jgi:SpoVK/Ycf46/Vps4 family AAA+-type ATPase
MPPSKMSPSHTVILEQALCHAALLVERLLFYSRNLGLLPRLSTENDPLGPIVISDEDVRTITAGFRKITQTEPRQRRALLQDPFGPQIAESRAALLRLIDAAEAPRLGFAEIVRAFGLAERSLDPFIIAIAPEWDARIGRLLGFLNNDSTQQRPTSWHLLTAMQDGLPTVDAEAIGRLEEELVKPGLISIDAAAEAPVAMQFVRVPLHVVERSRSTIALSSVKVRAWDDLRWTQADKEALRADLERELFKRAEVGGASRRIVILEGPPGCGRTAATSAAAHDAGRSVVPFVIASDNGAEIDTGIRRAAFQARVSGALLVVRSDGMLAGSVERWRSLAAAHDNLRVPCCVLVRPDEDIPVRTGIRFVRVAMPQMGPEERHALWSEVLVERGLEADEGVIADISTRYALTPGRINDLSEEMHVRKACGGGSAVSMQDFSNGLRAITSHKLKDLATRYVADSSLEDLVLLPAVRERLEELVHRLRHRFTVMNTWRFGGPSQRGYGVSALFTGPPGTGKTAAAAAVAKALNIDLFVVDLSRIMSKWVGETEQNLARVFDEAEASSVALLFDEADSLFGKRSSDPKSSSDRYGNITVNYLLQRMERYSGLAILTTNLESAIDTAFSRRITSRIEFPAPDKEQRHLLWQGLLPRSARFASDVDLWEIAKALDMPGARIRSALVRAAYRAAAAGNRDAILNQPDIEWAASAEYEDMGRLVPFHQEPANEGRDPDNDKSAEPTGDNAAAASSQPPQRERRLLSDFPFPKRREQ